MTDLLKQLLDLMPLAEASADLWPLPLQVHVSPGTELEIVDAKGFGFCYFSGMESDKHPASLLVAAANLLTPENLKHLYACVKVIENSRPNV